MTEITLHVSEPDADDERLDDLARQLRSELLDLGSTESVLPLVTGAAPDGTRSGLVAAAGALLVAVQPQVAALAQIVSVMREWLSRGAATRSIRLEVDGDVLELTGATRAVQEQLVAEWVSRRHATTTPAPTLAHE